MKIIIISLVLLAYSCEDDGVSPNNGCTITDAVNYDMYANVDDGSCVIPENTNLLTYESYFRSVLDQYCFGCHGYSNLDRNQFLSTGWVVLGNPSSSSLYSRINLPESNPLSMPQGQSNLGQDLIDEIQTWIENDCP